MFHWSGASAWARKGERAEAGAGFTQLPGVASHLGAENPGERQRNGSDDPDQPLCFINLSVSQRAGPAPSMSGIWTRDWEKGQEAPLLRARIPLTKDPLSFSLAGEIQVRPERGLPRGTEREVGSLSQSLQSPPWKCQCISLAPEPG